MNISVMVALSIVSTRCAQVISQKEKLKGDFLEYRQFGLNYEYTFLKLMENNILDSKRIFI